MNDTTSPVRPSHVGLCVSDLDRALEFYCDGLGFDRGERYDLDSTTADGLERSLEVEGHVAVTSQFVRMHGMAVELLHYADPDPTGAPSTTRAQLGLTHLAFHVDDLEATLTRLVEHGGTVIESTRADLGVRLAFTADPDGNRIELMQRP